MMEFLTFFFGHILYLYLAIYLPIAVYCIRTNTAQSFCAAILLGGVVACTWAESLWTSPPDMAIAHLGILLVYAFLKLFYTLHGRTDTALLLLAFLMLTTDLTWVVILDAEIAGGAPWYFPQDLFYWQSVIMLLFLGMCGFSAKGCYYHRKGGKQGPDVAATNDMVKELASEAR